MDTFRQFSPRAIGAPPVISSTLFFRATSRDENFFPADSPERVRGWRERYQVFPRFAVSIIGNDISRGMHLTRHLTISDFRPPGDADYAIYALLDVVFLRLGCLRDAPV